MRVDRGLGMLGIIRLCFYKLYNEGGKFYECASVKDFIDRVLNRARDVLTRSIHIYWAHSCIDKGGTTATEFGKKF